MYAAAGSKWAKEALANPSYKPSRLTNVCVLPRRCGIAGVQLYGRPIDRGSGPGQLQGREDFASDSSGLRYYSTIIRSPEHPRGSMDLTTLAGLLKDAAVTLENRGLRSLSIPNGWYPGEDRLFVYNHPPPDRMCRNTIGETTCLSV